MSIERSISLDTAISQGTQTHVDVSSGQQQGSEASMADREAFDRALNKSDDNQESPADSASDVPRPFSLFGSGPMGAATSVMEDGVSQELARSLSESAEQLLVGDGSNGKHEVRIELKSDVLPGVAVAIFEDEGRLVAAFRCRNEDSRERLNAGAARLAEELADSLKRAVLVQVSTDDPDDLRLLEAGAQG